MFRFRYLKKVNATIKWYFREFDLAVGWNSRRGGEPKVSRKVSNCEMMPAGVKVVMVEVEREKLFGGRISRTWQVNGYGELNNSNNYYLLALVCGRYYIKEIYFT